MRDDELAEVEAQLRGLIEEMGLPWVLDAVDRSITEGVSEERVLRRRRTPQHDHEPPVYETVVGSEREFRAASRSETLVITTRPMTARERVEQFLIALRRILLELPDIEGHTLALLSDSDAERRTPVETVAFHPVDADHARREPAHDLARPDPERREYLRRVLDNLAAEVRG